MKQLLAAIITAAMLFGCGDGASTGPTAPESISLDTTAFAIPDWPKTELEGRWYFLHGIKAYPAYIDRSALYPADGSGWVYGIELKVREDSVWLSRTSYTGPVSPFVYYGVRYGNRIVGWLRVPVSSFPGEPIQYTYTLKMLDKR